MTRVLADWLLTWWLHSVLMTGAALLVAGRVRSAGARDVTWKVALLLPLFTSLLVSLAPVRPRATLGVASMIRPLVPSRFNRVSVDERVIRTPAGARRQRVELDPVSSGTSALVLGIALAGTLAGLAAFARGVVVQRRVLATRHAPTGMAGSFPGVTISESDALDSPVALVGREICLTPSCWLLSDDERAALLAHELAHLERRDPEWFVALDLLVSLLFAQPLALLVLRRLRRDAEFICDEEAVRRTGDPASLLSSIIAFAGSPRDQRLGALAAYTTSPVVERGARIAAMSTGVPPTRVALALGVALVIGCAIPLAAPALVVRDTTARRLAQRDGVRVEVDSVVTMRIPARPR